MQLRALKQLTVQTAEAILRDRVAAVGRATSDHDPLPRVRVTIDTHVFSGIPARIENCNGEPWLVLVDGDEVAHLPLRAVTTVVVQHIPGPPLPDAPTRLNLERALAAAQAHARAAGWPEGTLAIAWPEPTTEDHRRAIDHAVALLPSMFESITKDPIGRESIASVARCVLVPAAYAELAVVRKDTTLEITIGSAAIVDAGALRRLVEQQL